MPHANAPLTPAGRLRLVRRCQSRPIAHVAAEAGTATEALRARLGEPADYAAELRAAIGYAQPSTSLGGGLQERAAAATSSPSSENLPPMPCTWR